MTSPASPDPNVDRSIGSANDADAIIRQTTAILAQRVEQAPVVSPESDAASETNPDSSHDADSELTPPDETRSDDDSAGRRSRGTPVIDPEPLPAPLLGREPDDPDNPDRTADASSLLLDDVIDSVYRSYPLLDVAVEERQIAAGERLAAEGNFDLGINASSENGTLGFYRTYRQRIGFVQPVYHGGNVFAGYRIGRGTFEPWYKERETNEGGELMVGVAVPLARNRQIDPRRAELWRAGIGRQLADPEINAQLIGFVQEAGYAYWNWVAAGEKFRIAERILVLAEDRVDGIRRQVEEGLLDPPELTDNLRLIAERRAARANARRQLDQAGIRLSLYYRGPDGRPLMVASDRLPDFPEVKSIDAATISDDITMALNQRPEVSVLTFLQRQLEIDLAQAGNEFRPAIDAVVAASQDVGEPATPLNDKGEFELDAALLFEMPVQRRRARGKMISLRAKINQLVARRRLVEDKIVADVQTAYAALLATYDQVSETRQAVEFATDLARREGRNYDLGATDLLTVALREQFAVEAADRAVDALLQFFIAQTDYRAALALDQLP